MEQQTISVSEPCHEQKQYDSVPSISTDGTQDIDNLFETAEPQKDLQPENLDSVLLKSSGLNKQLEEISNTVKGCQEQLTRLCKETEQLKAADQVVANLSTCYRDLSEQFYEREVLLPVIYCLIRVIDGCRQQIDKLQKTREKHSDSKNESAMKAMTFLIDGRKADLIEVESALANLGVESYQHNEDTFEPSLQKCIQRIECEDNLLDGRIAVRLLPGYKRHGKVIKKEYVNVYVAKNKINNTSNGGN